MGSPRATGRPPARPEKTRSRTLCEARRIISGRAGVVESLKIEKRWRQAASARGPRGRVRARKKKKKKKKKRGGGRGPRRYSHCLVARRVRYLDVWQKRRPHRSIVEPLTATHAGEPPQKKATKPPPEKEGLPHAATAALRDESSPSGSLRKRGADYRMLSSVYEMTGECCGVANVFIWEEIMHVELEPHVFCRH